jgi:hypothetical protein
MHRSATATLLFILAVAHLVGGAMIADAESATLIIPGASGIVRWVATQLLGASIAGYAVGGLATLGAAVPASWRSVAAIAGAVSSLGLAGLLSSGAMGPWPLVITIADTLVIMVSARDLASAEVIALARVTR